VCLLRGTDWAFKRGSGHLGVLGVKINSYVALLNQHGGEKKTPVMSYRDNLQQMYRKIPN